MSEPFIGEIKMLSYAWAPKNWALCDGAMLQVSQHAALNALLSSTFGGDGRTVFALPDLRGRTPIATGQNSVNTYILGSKGGQESVALDIKTTPAHAHNVMAMPTPATALQPNDMAFSNVSAAGSSTANFSVYQPNGTWSANTALAQGTISAYGQSTPHNNMQPFAVVNFIICIIGSFPPRN